MDKRTTKRTYATPSLVNYGSIAKLTHGASGEGPGPGGGGGGPIIDIMVILML